MPRVKKIKPPKELLQVPFDSAGNMQRVVTYTYNYSYTTSVRQPPTLVSILKENYEFDDTLKFQRIVRTNSSNYVSFLSMINGRAYYMFMKDLETVLKKHCCKMGIVQGRFTFRKSGTKFGIKIISSDKLDIMA